MTQALSQTESSTLPSQGEFEAIAVPPGSMDDFIEKQIRKHLEPAMELSHGKMNVESVIRAVRTYRAQLFFGIQDREVISVVLTEIAQWDNGKRCVRVLLAGGRDSMESALYPLMEKVEDFAMASLCSSITVEGRKGWERVLPEGYKFSHSVFEKEIL